MTTVTWSDVSDAANTYIDAEGYVLSDYVADDYVVGLEASPNSWTTVSSQSTVWA